MMYHDMSEVKIRISICLFKWEDIGIECDLHGFRKK